MGKTGFPAAAAAALPAATVQEIESVVQHLLRTTDEDVYDAGRWTARVRERLRASVLAGDRSELDGHLDEIAFRKMAPELIKAREEAQKDVERASAAYCLVAAEYDQLRTAADPKATAAKLSGYRKAPVSAESLEREVRAAKAALEEAKERAAKALMTNSRAGFRRASRPKAIAS